MKHNIYSIILASASIMGLTGCEKEATFNLKPGEGQLNCEALSVDYINRGKTRADVQVGDFTVNFVNTATNEVARSFKYSKMPEIVALPVGNYRAEAEYGDNPVAAWEEPYYTGNTTFGIQEGKVTDDIDPVECTLSNIKITVNVNDLGLGILEDDVKVIVSAGEEGELIYNSSTNDKAGYFRHVDGSQTITAHFTGTVDGVKVDQTVAYDNAAEGNSYNLNFEINRPDNVDPGSIVITESGITLDATITIADETHEVDPNEPEDGLLEDTMRPVEDGSGSGDEPGDDPTGNGPEIIPYGFELGVPYHITAEKTTDEEGNVQYVTPVKFTVTSETGFTEFKINIDSTTLTPDELDGAGLGADLDLINPGEFEEGLSGLGFPVKDEVKNQKECNFDISGFIDLLNILGSGTHKFNLTVSDSNGTTQGTVWLEN